MNSWWIFVCFVLIVENLTSFTAAANVNQREILPQQPQTHTGSYTSVYSSYADPNTNAIATTLDRQGSQYGGYAAQYPQPQPNQYGQQSYGYSQPNQQYGYKDPGFSMQTGFEGFLVPNPLYSVLPWGIETVLLAIVGIVIFVAFKMGLIFFLIKFLKIGKIFKSDLDTDVRSYIPSFFNKEYLTDLASTVFDAVDRYNEVTSKDEMKQS